MCAPVTPTGARLNVEMRRLFFHAEQGGPFILYPLALILGLLLAYGWWLVVVGVILPAFTQLVGAD